MRALYLFASAAVLTTACAVVGCDYYVPPAPGWTCRDPATGKPVDGYFDLSHYVNGVFDPCNCLDPGGPQPTCLSYMPDAGADAGLDADSALDAGTDVVEDAGADALEDAGAD